MAILYKYNYVIISLFGAVVSYEWKDLVGPTKIVTPTADFMTYEYDSKNRLAKETDSHGSLVQTYQYHYNNE